MDLHPNRDQDALVEATTDWLEEYMPFDQARARPAGLPHAMADMGWLAMTVPEDDGGLGVDHASEVLVFAELGRFLAPIGALSSAVEERWFDVEERTALAIASGARLRVLDGHGATTALVTGPDRTDILPLPAGLDHRVSLDLTTTQALADRAPARRSLDDPRPHLHLTLLAAAYALGVADAARNMASEYAAMRQQFGKAIGSFQGVKHPCADMAVRSAVARSQLYFAACAFDAGAADLAFHVGAAKRLADGAALDNARANIQVHGGIGMTDAANPHLLLKRAHLLQFVAPVSTAVLLDTPLASA